MTPIERKLLVDEDFRENWFREHGVLIIKSKIMTAEEIVEDLE